MRFPGKSAPAATASAGSSISESRSRLSFGVLATTLVCAAAFLGIGAPAAGAATPIDSYGYAGMQFGFGDSGFGGQSFFNGVAVDPTTGNILISRNGNGLVDVYAPDPVAGGTELTNFSPLNDNVFPANLAVDRGDGSVYVEDDIIAGGTIRRYLTDGQPTPTYTLDPSFAAPGNSGLLGGIAVDPTTHDVLAAEESGRRVVRLAAADGSELGSFNGSDAPAGPFESPRGIAVSASGTIYVADAGRGAVDRFDSTGAWQGSFELAAGDEPQSIAINDVTGDVAVLVSRGGSYFVEGFNAAGIAKWQSRVWFDTGGSLIGIAWDGNLDRIYLGAASGRISTLVPATQPGVDAPVLVSNDADSAIVTADVAAGAETTTAWIEYCPAAAACGNYAVSNSGDSSNPWVRGPAEENFTGDKTLESDLPLPPVSQWKVRTVATNAKTENRSAEVTLETLPVAPLVTTGAAGSVTDSQAELTGTIDTLGSQTTYHFEYGTDTSYGSQVPAGLDAAAGNNRTPRSVVQAIAGLQPGTVYHYRLVAQNAGGETVGDDRTFETAAEPAPPRSYEQVTPVDKEGAQVASEAHVQMDPAGNWIAVASASGAASDEGVRMRQNYLVRREADGWSDWSPIEAPQQAAGGLFESSTTGVSPDGNHALVVSNKVLAPGGAFAGGGNLYAKDLRTGEYTFVAGAPGNDAYQSLANGLANECVFIASAPDFSWVLFWSLTPLAPDVTNSAIYRWTPSGGLTVESQVPDPLDPTAEVPAVGAQLPSAYKLVLPSASTDGTVVGFGASGGIYRRADGVTTPISVSEIPGDPEDPQTGVFDGISADGRYVFFHTATRLTEDSPADNGQDTFGYRYDAVTETLKFTMRIANGTETVFGNSLDGSTLYAENLSGIQVWREDATRSVSPEKPSASVFKARVFVSDSGQYFAWIGADEQAYLYDLEADQRTCASCPVDGSIPKEARFLFNARYIGNTLPRVATDGGMMFFDTATPLVSSDRNGKRDVYAFKDGRLTLISPGNGNFDAVWVGASADGRDVYFQTDQSLVTQDVDGSSDVYDARVGGGFASQNPPPPPPLCIRSDCSESTSGPVVSPPVSSQALPPSKASAPKRCKKGYVKKTVKGKQRCVKKPKHKKSASKKQSKRSRNGK